MERNVILMREKEREREGGGGGVEGERERGRMQGGNLIIAAAVV